LETQDTEFHIKPTQPLGVGMNEGGLFRINTRASSSDSDIIQIPKTSQNSNKTGNILRNQPIT
jgi:hypothetical protein